MVVDRNSVIPLAKGKGEQKQPMLYIRSAAGELVIYYDRKRFIFVTELHKTIARTAREGQVGAPTRRPPGLLQVDTSRAISGCVRERLRGGV